MMSRRDSRRSTRTRRTIALVVIAAVVVLVGAGITVWVVRGGGGPSIPTSSASATAGPLQVLTNDTTAAGLIAYTDTTVPDTADAVYTISADTTVYGADKATPVGVFSPTNQLGGQTVLVVVEQQEQWSLVLTPSASDTPTAQTAGWVHSSDLTRGQNLTSSILISVKDSTLTVVGADGKKSSPVSITVADKGFPQGLGYITLRYVDDTVGEGTTPINVTSLHSTTGETFGDRDGSSLVIHNLKKDDGSDTDAPIRVPSDTAELLATLPLGTLIVIQ